jgi:hypothetical protein
MFVKQIISEIFEAQDIDLETLRTYVKECHQM